MPEPNQEHRGSGDNVGRDKIENHIKIDYQEKVKASVCPFCYSEFDVNPERRANKIKCGNCGIWSGDPNFDKSLALRFPNVPKADNDEFIRLKGRIDNEIKLGQYDSAFKNSEKLTKMCPEAPHSFLYNALSIYYYKSKDEIINESASMILRRLELAKEKFHKDDEQSDYDLISSTIAINYFYLLRGVLSQIHGFYFSDKSIDKKHTVNIYYKHIKELYTCFKIYPDINFLKTAIKYFYGHYDFGWFEFEPNQLDYLDIKNVISEKLYNITEKHKGVKNLLQEMESEILKVEPEYRLPEQKIDFSKVTGSERPTTLNSLFQDVTIYSEEVERWEKNSKNRIEKIVDVTIDEIIELIKTKNPVEYNRFRILRGTENREIYYYVQQNITAVKRDKVNYKLFLFPAVRDKFSKITKSAQWSVNNLKKYDNAVDFSKNEAVITIVETSEYKDLPIRRDKKYIYNPQPTYFYPDQIKIETCTSCNGHKYLVCNSCNGRHKIPCEICRQQGYVNCNNCQSRGSLICKKCSGSGYVMKGSERVTCTKGVLGHLDNSGCNGTGRVACLQCDGHGRIKCKNCKGVSYTECAKCHGDANNRETYGKMDCDGCHAAGEIAIFNTIKSTIIERHDRAIVLDNNVVSNKNIVASKILSLFSTKEATQEVYFKANEQRGIGHSETTKMLSDKINENNCIYYEKYPMLISEFIYYEIIPVFNIKFKQTITNKIHELSVIGYDEPNSIIFFHSNLKEELKSLSDWNDILDRAFYNRRYRDKVDKRNEIVLMIYMAKSDWVIEEKEKEIIEDRISGIENFTKAEQSDVFQLIDTERLPALDAKYTIFSSNQAENIVKTHLIKLIAESDGNYESSEKIMFDLISSMIDQNRSRRLNSVTAFVSTWQVSVPVIMVVLLVLILIFR